MLQIEFVGATEKVITTLGHTLRLAGAEMLQLDHRELGFFAEGCQVRLFENTPGGCGHLLELEKRGKAWLTAAREKLTGTAKHHAECQTACLGCILSTASQFDVEGGKIDRLMALDYLVRLLQHGSVPVDEAPVAAVAANPPPVQSIDAALTAYKQRSEARSRRKPIDR